MRTVMKYYKPYVWLIVFNLLFLLGQAMCELALPGYMSDIINNGIVVRDMDYIKRTGLIMLAVSAATVCCSLLSSFAGYKTRVVHASHSIFGG